MTDSVASPPQTTRRSRPHLALSTMMLLTTCVATLVAAIWNNRQRQYLQDQIEVLRPFLAELAVQDLQKIAAVRRHPTKYDEMVWDIYLPDSARTLKIATKGIPDQRSDFDGSVIADIPLPSGRHVVELICRLKGEQWLIEVELDGVPVISHREPKEWNTPSTSSSGVQSNQKDFAIGERAVLLNRKQINAASTAAPDADDPRNGIRLWID